MVLAGVTYKANISDLRETPAGPLAMILRDQGARLSYVDPHVDRFEVDGCELEQIADLRAITGGADIVILLQAHDEFLAAGVFASAHCVFDTTGQIDGLNVERL